MTSQYLRYCSVTVEGGPGAMNLSDLRCRFAIAKHAAIGPAIAEVRISNLSEAKGRQIANKEFATLTLDAGYQDGHGVIFKGNIVQGIYGRESPTETLTTIFARDGDHGHNFATVSATLPPGSTPQDQLNVAMAALGKFGITAGYIGVDLSKPVYPQA